DVGAESMSLPELIEAYTGEFLFSTPSTRCSLLHKIIAALSDAEQSEVDECFKPLLVGLVKTLHQYADRRSRTLVNKALESLCTASSENAVKTFPVVITKLAARKGYNVLAINTLLNWTMSFISAVGVECVLANPDVLKSLALAQAKLVSAVYEVDNRRGNQRCRATVDALLHKGGRALCDSYLSVLEVAPSAYPGKLAGLIVDHANRYEMEEIVAEHMPNLVKLYQTTIVKQKVLPPLHECMGFRAILSAMPAESYVKDILPPTMKSFLRNSSVGSVILASQMDSLESDLSHFVDDFMSAVRNTLNHKEENIRDNGVEFCTSLCTHLSSPASLTTLTSGLVDMVSGKGPVKVSAWAHKVHVAQALEAVAKAAHDTTKQQVAADVVTAALAAADKEANETAQLAEFSAVEQWLPFVSVLPQKVLDAFANNYLTPKAKPTCRSAALKTLSCGVATSSCTKDVCASLVPNLLAIIDSAVAKPAHAAVADATYAAYYLLAWTQGDNASVALPLKKGGDLRNVITTMEVLCSPKLLANADVPLQRSIARLSTCVLSANPGEWVNAQSPWVAAVLRLSVSEDVGVRRQCVAAVSGAVRDDRDVDEKLDVLLSVFDALFLEPEIPLTQNKEFLMLTATAICGVSGNGTKSTHEHMALKSLLVFNHPRVGSKKAYHRMLRHAQVDIESFIRDNLEEVIALTTGDLGVGSENPHTQQAAIAAIKDLLVHVGDATVLPYLKWAMASLDSPLILSVDAYKKNVYTTPEGELYNNEVLESIKRSQAPAPSRAKKGKKTDLEEEAWQKKIRDDQARKRGEDPNAIKMTAHQREQVEAERTKEAAIRSEVAAIATDATRVFSVLLAICSVNPKQLRANTPLMLAILKPLLTSPLVGDVSQQVWYSMMGSLDKKFLANCQPTVVCQYTLRQLNTRTLSAEENTELQKGVGAAVTKLFMSTAGTRSLANPEFSYCFELLRSILAHPVPSYFPVNVQRQALGLVKRHLPAVMKSSLYPRSDLIQLLLLVADVHDHLQAQAVDSLVLVGAEVPRQLDDTVLRLLSQGLLSPIAAIRLACLKALNAQPIEDYDRDEQDMTQAINRIKPHVLALKYDADDAIKTAAEEMLDDKDLEINTLEEVRYIATLVENPTPEVQEYAVRGLSAALSELPDYTNEITEGLLDRIPVLLSMPEPVYDDNRNLISEPFVDPWEARRGLAMALNHTAVNISDSELQKNMTFISQFGFTDRNAEVRAAMLAAASQLIDVHGASSVNEMLPVMEETLARTTDTSDDEVHEATIICIGAMARHLDKTDPKVQKVIALLFEALKTPSQSVQEAVAKCLPPLINAKDENAGELIKTLLDQLLEGKKFSDRKGAAYGLAAVVKGLGILSLRKHAVVDDLMDAVQNKKRKEHREGGLMAFETMVSTLGRLFEPYVIKLLPHLLVAFGDNDENVRLAAQDTAAAIIKHLSQSSKTGPGVKLVLPSLMRALDDKQWRTKQGATEMLGAMSACAPDQLSSSLPQIVPRLAEVLTDSHPKVQEAGRLALKKIGGVIKNPEIQEIVDVLLAALVDPDGKTQKCLTTLLDTNFVHFIDAPSLALIMPVLHRALKQRSTETKMWAAQIIGNMSSLTNHKDLQPYLNIVLPGLREVLVDSSPAVREVSAKALGTMVQGMGEESFSELIPWLVETLKSPGNSAVDRSGAAQGLSEVLYGLGSERLERLLPDIIANCSAKEAYTREGFMMVLFFTPSSFGDDLLPFVPVVIPPILKGLADEAENVRHAALKAGQMIVNNYAESAVEILLPELEKGLFDDNWRIRQSSVHLLGDLLYRISGQSGAKTTESGGDDDNFGTTEARDALVEVLGEERLAQVFAGLYMGRSDVAPLVRQASLHIWKVVVFNTARTLRDIMPVLMQLLLKSLSSPNHDRRRIAAQTLGDVVLKLGDFVLPEIVPILAEGLDAEDSSTRCGVCVGLSEVMNAASKDSVIMFVSSIIPVVRQSLMDRDSEVREAAAKTFDTLFTVIGNKAVDEVLPSMLAALDSEDEEINECALLGLRQVMKTQSQVVLPFLVPKLIAQPVTGANAHALGALAVVSGSTLDVHLSKIVPALLQAICVRDDSSDSIQESFEQIIMCLETRKGQSVVMNELIEMLGHHKAVYREVASKIIVVIADTYDIEVCEEQEGEVHPPITYHTILPATRQPPNPQSNQPPIPQSKPTT
ncbi:hypothetical protein SARC_07418, partial [Sphaeroforma arctica JP610]